MERLDEINATLRRAFSELEEIFSDPASLTFATVREHVEQLEGIVHAKALIDASFAHLCERDDAGRHVGSRYPSAYLAEKLGISRAEAHNRLARGRDLFAPPEPEPGADAGDDADAAGSDAEREKKDQRRARKRSARVAAEKQRIINHELRALLPGATPGRAELLADALRAAATRSPEDLRRWVRRRVEQANARAPRRPNPRDPLGPYRNRGARIGLQRTDGTCDITITAPAGEAALIKALLDAGLHPGSNLPEGEAEKDSRTPGQRRFDQLAAIFHHYEATGGAGGRSRGAASVVLAVTPEDLARAGCATRLATNTGIDLDCYDILRLGLCGSDFVVQLDPVSEMPLAIGRTRLANLAQRLALFAAQGVCAWEDCTTPFSELEIHHLDAFAAGGATSIDNLIGLCRQHHRCNNDRKDFGGGLNHMARDPGTGRVGVAHPDGTIRFNTTEDAERAPGRRLRHRERTRAGSPAAPV